MIVIVIDACQTGLDKRGSSKMPVNRPQNKNNVHVNTVLYMLTHFMADLWAFCWNPVYPTPFANLRVIQRLVLSRASTLKTSLNIKVIVIYVSMYPCIHVSTYLCIYVSMCLSLYTYNIYIYIHTHTYTYTQVYITYILHIYIYIYIYMYLFIFFFIYFFISFLFFFLFLFYFFLLYFFYIYIIGARDMLPEDRLDLRGAELRAHIAHT